MATYEVSAEYAFSARHAIRLPDGQLEPPHEHLWQVTATFRTPRLSRPGGMVVDFVAVQYALRTLAEGLEGKDLQDLPAFREVGSSAERVAEFLAGQLAARMPADADKLHRLSVTEAPGCTAAYYPKGA